MTTTTQMIVASIVALWGIPCFAAVLMSAVSR